MEAPYRQSQSGGTRFSAGGVGVPNSPRPLEVESVRLELDDGKGSDATPEYCGDYPDVDLGGYEDEYEEEAGGETRGGGRGSPSGGRHRADTPETKGCFGRKKKKGEREFTSMGHRLSVAFRLALAAGRPEAEESDIGRRKLHPKSCKDYTCWEFVCGPRGTVRRYLLVSLATFIALCIVLVIVVSVKASEEMKVANSRPNTTHYYTAPEVCGTDPTVETGVLATYPSVSSAHSSGAYVAHCGPCGSCSDRNDMGIYNDTLKTLTEATTRCATLGILGGKGRVSKCMMSKVDFTDGCRDCWVDNVMCDMRHCLFTCIKSLALREKKVTTDKSTGEPILNDCLKCDERVCGPAFIECAGANRRRSGMRSDIKRDTEQEVCDVVDKAWWSAT